MKAIKRFWVMFCTAGMLLFCGLDLSTATPKQMILMTGAACGVVNMIWSWLEDK